MGKRIGVVLLIAVIFFAGGAWLFFRAARRPANRGTTLKSEVARVTPPAGGAPASAPPETAPPVTAIKGAGSELPGFSPRTGEVLDFAANVTKLNSTVANLKVKVGERRSVGGKSALHLQAFAHTENPYRMVFELDDQFDSYSDATNLASLQYELHLNERGQKVDTVERMLFSGKDPAPPDAVAARVLPGTRDPIGFLMYLRGTDWSQTKEVRSPVFDGHKLYDVRAVAVAKSQRVSVAAGKYMATKIEIHVLDNGAEMKDAHFLLYITEDADRLPVLMEAVLPIATASVELTKVH